MKLYCRLCTIIFPPWACPTSTLFSNFHSTSLLRPPPLSPNVSHPLGWPGLLPYLMQLACTDIIRCKFSDARRPFQRPKRAPKRPSPPPLWLDTFVNENVRRVIPRFHSEYHQRRCGCIPQFVVVVKGNSLIVPCVWPRSLARTFRLSSPLHHHRPFPTYLYSLAT